MPSIAEDGQGMVDIRSQIMAVRLCSVKKIAIWIAITKPSPGFSHSAASGWLGYGRECFLVMLQCVHTSSLSDFYQSLLNAWQSLSVCRQQDTDVMKMFAQEPLFHHLLFPSIPRSRDFCQHFISAGMTKVRHLRHVSRSWWKSTQEIADLTGTRSRRVIGEELREVTWMWF